MHSLPTESSESKFGRITSQNSRATKMKLLQTNRKFRGVRLSSDSEEFNIE
jgi:hypothetical protein